jgi:hypothetical protein
VTPAVFAAGRNGPELANTSANAAMLSFGNGVRQQVDQIKFPTIAAALLTPRGILRGRLSDGSPARCLSGPRAAVGPHSLGDRNDSGFALQPGSGQSKPGDPRTRTSAGESEGESFTVDCSSCCLTPLPGALHRHSTECSVQAPTFQRDHETDGIPRRCQHFALCGGEAECAAHHGG